VSRASLWSLLQSGLFHRDGHPTILSTRPWDGGRGLADADAALDGATLSFTMGGPDGSVLSSESSALGARDGCALSFTLGARDGSVLLSEYSALGARGGNALSLCARDGYTSASGAPASASRACGSALSFTLGTRGGSALFRERSA